MVNMNKTYYIMDFSGNYYKMSKKNNLVQAKDSEDADMFSLREANEKISGSKKADLFTTVEAWTPVAEEPADAVAQDICDEITTPTLFDGLDNNWEETVSKLCYMCAHIQTYRANLNTMLSAIDQEICDVVHYMEFENPDDIHLLRVAKLLQEKRHKRREIKNEMDRVDLLKSTFLDEEFSIKVHQSLEYLQKMKNKKYTPRRLQELFNTTAVAS